MKELLTLQISSSMAARYTPENAKWNYVNGLGLECILRSALALSRQDYIDYVIRMFDLFLHEDGSISTYREDEYSMDQMAPGKAFFPLLEITGEQKYRLALDSFRHQLKNQPRTDEGVFWHKKIYPGQMWLDGLYMEAPFLVHYDALFGDLQSALKDVTNQAMVIYRHTLDEKTGLLYHAYDSYHQMSWCDKTTGRSPCIWGRAMGWFVMALVDILDYVPERDVYTKEREMLIGLISSLAPAIAKVQDESGMWYQVLDQGGREHNYLESSASSMFTYFFAKSVRKGYLPPSYRTIAEKGFEGICRLKVRKDENGEIHLMDICRGAGLGQSKPIYPFRTGTYLYYTTEEPRVEDNMQGIGPFLLATMEIEIPEKIK